MSYLDGIERELVIGESDIYREFDVSNFISNAKTAITGKVDSMTMDIKINHYGTMLEKAIGNFNNIKLDKDSIKDFASHYETYSRIDNAPMLVNDISYMDVVTLKPQYLEQFANMVGSTIDKVLKGTIDRDEIERYLCGDVVTRVKKQVVKSTLDPCYSAKDLIKIDCSKPVKLDTAYIKTKLLPFILKYDSIKSEALTEANSVLSAIRETENTLNAMKETIHKLKVEGNISADTAQKLSYVSYNALRGMIDVISYVTYMEIRKLNILSSNMIAAEKAYTDIMNAYADGTVESGLDGSIIPTDSASLADDLISGRSDAYDTLSKNIYDFHAGIPGVDMIDEPVASLGDSLHSAVDATIDNANYNRYPYDEVNKMYILISQGCDIIAASSDEYLLVFDDIIEKAGFVLRLVDRFRGVISTIDDTSAYVPVEGSTVDKSMYARILSEVKDYGKNMDIIAKNILDTHTKMDMLTKRFNDNINGEFKDAEAVNELKIFMKDLDEQYRTLTNTVAAKFMGRLKTLGNTLAEMEASDSTQSVTNDVTPTVELDTTDYVEMAYDSILQDKEENTKMLFNALESSYFIEREHSLRGVNVILEANDNNTNTSNGTTPQQNSTTPTVTDNSSATADAKAANGAIGNINAKIREWLNKAIDAFTSFIGKQGARNSKWLSENKSELTNRSYSNVALQILPYDSVPAETITQQIGTVTNVLNGFASNVKTIQGIKDKNQLYAKLFPFVKGGIKDESQISLKDQFVNYYKCGNSAGPLNTITVSNNQLKNMVTMTIIPFCESYYDRYANTIQVALQNLADATDKVIVANSGKATTESVSIFNEEAVDDTQGNSISWMCAAVKLYSGSILNAIRDRNNDYFKALSNLVPKTPSAQQNEKPNNEAQNNK